MTFIFVAFNSTMFQFLRLQVGSLLLVAALRCMRPAARVSCEEHVSSCGDYTYVLKYIITCIMINR